MDVQVGQTLRVGGWVKTGREAGAGAWAFLEVNDGSCFDSLQVSKRCNRTLKASPSRNNRTNTATIELQVVLWLHNMCKKARGLCCN